jgi:hypothetical protein
MKRTTITAAAAAILVAAGAAPASAGGASLAAHFLTGLGAGIAGGVVGAAVEAHAGPHTYPGPLARPRFDPAAGSAVPVRVYEAVHRPAPPHGVAVVEYREPYIAPGLIYNVPPDPWLARSNHAIRAKY